MNAEVHRFPRAGNSVVNPNGRKLDWILIFAVLASIGMFCLALRGAVDVAFWAYRALVGG